METCNVYGKKNNEPEKLIFTMLAYCPACIKRAKRTAAEHHYTITRAVLIPANWYEPNRDITAEFTV